MADPALRLEEPALRHRAAFLELVDDYQRAGERRKHEFYSPGARDFGGYCEVLLQRGRGAGSMNGWVPESTFWMLDGEQRIAGIIRIRHHLNAYLEGRGGHVGYDVPPSRRRQGNGLRLLELGLVEAARLGLARVLLTCDADNLPSRRIIERCGGVYHDAHPLPGGMTLVRRYWIELGGG